MAEPITLPVPFDTPRMEMPAEKVAALGQQDDQARKDVELVRKLLDSAKKYRKKWDEKWDKLIAYYNGDQWYKQKRPAYRSSPVANRIRPVVQTVLPIITDASPSIDILPSDPTDFQFADMLSKAVKTWWERLDMQHRLVEVIDDAVKLNYGIMKIVWNPALQDGAGDVDAVVVDPKNLYYLEGSLDFNKRCPAIIELFPMSVSEAKKRWPEKEKYIVATQRPEDKSSSEQTRMWVVSPTDRDDGVDRPAPFVDQGASSVVWVAECWIDDEEIIDEAQENGDVVKRKKWPRGKVIWCIPEKNVHLSTEENPYEDGLKPYVRFVDTIIPRQIPGEGEIEPLIESQDMLNRCLAQIYDWLLTMTNPGWIVDVTTGVKPGDITNQVGMVIPRVGQGEIRRIEGASMPPQVFEFYQMMLNQIDSASGVHDITQGRKPQGITAAAAINDLQEAAQTRIRLKDRNMSTSIKQMGRMVVARILQYYTSPRMVKLTGQQGWPEYFEFYIEKTENGKYRPVKRGYSFDEESKSYSPDAFVQPQNESKGVFDVEVSAGTSLPFMKERRAQLSMQLYDRKAIDQQALLEGVDYPNKEQIIKRTQEQAQQAAEAQAQQQQQGAA